MKVIGIFIILISSFLMGAAKGQEYKERNRELLEIRKIADIIKNEIRYNQGTLYEIFSKISMEKYKKLTGALAKNKDKSFYEMWEECIVKEYEGEGKLKKEDLKKLREFGKNIGYLDREMQINMVDLYIKKLDEDIRESEKELLGNIRLYRSLGVLGGMFIVILLF